MAVWTNAGISQAAVAGVQNGVTYIAVGTGCSTLASALVSGTPYSSLTLNAGIPAPLATGTVLTITDGVNTDSATVASPGQNIGDTVITLSGYTAANNFAINVTSVTPTPLATDLALYNEIARVPANPGVAGATAGESLTSGYLDGTQPTNVYVQVGYFGGVASATLNSGTLMIEDIQYWSHTLDADSATFQADTII
jgi:hypothetical protein